MSSWTTLPREWQLEDVQAGLNVLITALSALSIFVFARFSWQLGASRVTGNTAVPLTSLLTLNNPGEVLDALLLLKNNLPSHWKLLAQCVVVILFSATTLVSGPIARYATRVTDVVVKTDIGGLLPGRQHNSNGDDQVKWNMTETRLNEANFPTDQLLDYLPDVTQRWQYREAEWNNSWTMACVSTEESQVDLSFTDNCQYLDTKIVGIEAVVPAWYYSDVITFGRGDFYESPDLFRDYLIGFYVANYTDYNNATDIYRSIDFSLAALRLHRAPRNSSSASAACDFLEGVPEYSVYTRIDCEVRYRDAEAEEAFYIAYPDCYDESAIPQSLIQYYFARFKTESMASVPVSPITPTNLVRYYQTYMIVKDVQYQQPVTRVLSVGVSAVQVSTAFLAIYCFVALLALLGATSYAIYLLRHSRVTPFLPQSKIDWMLQAVLGVLPQFATDPNPSNWAVTVLPPTSSSQSQPLSKRYIFENSFYGPSSTYSNSRQQVVYPDKLFQMTPTSPTSPVNLMSSNITHARPDIYLSSPNSYNFMAVGARAPEHPPRDISPMPPASPTSQPGYPYLDAQRHGMYPTVERYPSLRAQSPT